MEFPCNIFVKLCRNNMMCFNCKYITFIVLYVCPSGQSFLKKGGISTYEKCMVNCLIGGADVNSFNFICYIGQKEIGCI